MALTSAFYLSAMVFAAVSTILAIVAMGLDIGGDEVSGRLKRGLMSSVGLTAGLTLAGIWSSVP